MHEEPEPLVISVIAAPWRFIRGLFSGAWHRLLGRFPILAYGLERRSQDKFEVEKEMQEAAEATRELERKVEKYEKEGEG